MKNQNLFQMKVGRFLVLETPVLQRLIMLLISLFEPSVQNGQKENQ
jgi:hypothetical protein